MSWTQIGELAAVGTAVLWTCSAVAWTSAGRYIGALPVSFLRLAITCLFLMAYGLCVRGSGFPTGADAQTWQILGLSGFVGFFVADLCLFKSLLLIGPRLTLLMQSCSPPIAAVVSWLVLHDDLSGKDWVAMAVTLLGVTWVVLEQPEGQTLSYESRHLRWGVVLALVAAAGQAIGLVLSRLGIGQYDAVGATFIRVLPAMGGYIVLITLARRWPSIWSAAGHGRAMAITSLGSFVGPFAGVALCMVAVRHCPAGIAATIISTTPVLILPFAIFLYREKVSPRAAGGAMLSVLGVALLVM